MAVRAECPVLAWVDGTVSMLSDDCERGDAGEDLEYMTYTQRVRCGVIDHGGYVCVGMAVGVWRIVPAMLYG